ncbi:hypothetical protein [[Kitasatospora] papulosa]|uniref:hypothetical protein n=1 Tax=[Kitasatospora] papulosa TaxID=1464011 RepID=UPI0037169E5B
MDQEWEGPVPSELSGAAARAVQAAARPAVWVECRCGHEWQSRARDRMTIKCPECGTGQRVPHRTHDNTGAVPEGHRPAPRPRAARGRPAPVWEPREDPEDEWEPEPREAPVRPFLPPSAPGGLAAILAAFQNRSRPAPAPAAPAAPRPARPAVPNRPARVPAAPAGAAVQPIDPQQLPAKELKRRDDVCQMARSLSAPVMVWYNQPPGLCEAMDTTQPRDRQRCPATATHAVQFERDVTVTHAFTCPAHTRPLAATADHSPYITATIRSVR